MNWAATFMAVQIVTCALGAVGFAASGRPWLGMVWLFYGAANVGWLVLALGKA